MSRPLLHWQVQQAMAELTALTAGLLDAAAGDASGVIWEVPIGEVETVFAAVAQAASGDLLDVRGSRRGLPRWRAAATRHRILVEASLAEPAPPAPGLAELISGGALVRTLEWVPFSIVVADGQTVVAAMDDGDSLGYLLVERGSQLARSVSRVVELWWDRAQTVGTRFPDGVGLVPCAARSAMEAAIISALAEGDTDETVARRLGVTPRTVRRYVADISERYGASSRLQLGVLLGRSGAVWDRRFHDGVRDTAAG